MISIKLWELIIISVFAVIGVVLSGLFIISLIHDICSHFYWKHKFKKWNK